MTDSVTHSARSFADFYGISRPRLSRIISAALRDHSGVFGIQGFGYFQAAQPEPKHLVISPYNPTKIETETIQVWPVSGREAPLTSAPVTAQPQAHQSSASAQSAATTDPDSEYALKLEFTRARIDRIKQQNVLEQARLREETVGYCSTVFQLLLTNLRQELDAMNLDRSAADTLRQAIANALSDLQQVIPQVIAGAPTEQIDLALSTIRADRFAASRLSSLSHDPQQADLTNCNQSTSNLHTGA